MRMLGAASTLLAVVLVLQLSAVRPEVVSASNVQNNDGREAFRFDTFGDEQLWTDTLRMQEAVATLSPKAALSLGLKVDSEALPPSIINAIKTSQVNLDDPAVTIELLRLNAVVGVMGKVVGRDRLTSIGITCAFCHSTVDNSVAPGIGRRLDGWGNITLNVGAIVAASPALMSKSPFADWGPGKYDPRFHAFDGSSFIPLHSTSSPVVIPSIFGLQNVGFETFTGDGPISYWNSYVGVSQMGGQGNFSDDRGVVHLTIIQKPDRVTRRLPELLAYQLSLHTPPAPGPFDAAAARRGGDLFTANCARCHQPPTYTDVSSGPDPKVPVLHAASETGVDPEYARRSATLAYRTTPLRALWQHPPYFHNGSAADLAAVVEHYNGVLKLGLTPQQKADLVEFLKTL